MDPPSLLPCGDRYGLRQPRLAPSARPKRPERVQGIQGGGQQPSSWRLALGATTPTKTPAASTATGH
jgi:hypothetical protein